MRLVCRTFMVLLLGWSSPGFAASLDEMTEFRGIPFGERLERLEGLQAKRYNSEVFYVRSGDEMQFEGVPVDQIGYQFTDGYFTGVLVFTQSMDRSRALFNALQKAYGAPVPHPQKAEARVWRGQRTRAELQVVNDRGLAVLRMNRAVRVLGPAGPRVVGGAGLQDFTGGSAPSGGDGDGDGDGEGGVDASIHESSGNDMVGGGDDGGGGDD
jgi:hypothetical protein